jgi:hypothetical protein
MPVVIHRVLADFDLPDLERALGAAVTRSASSAPDYAAWLGPAALTPTRDPR